VDPAAYQAYLRGLYYVEKGSEESASESQRYFQQATAKDPGYARAWVGLARAYNRVEEYGRAKESAQRAIALDETVGEAHTTLAFATWNQDWDWAAAEREFKRAIELDPNESVPHHGYGVYLSALGRHEEAVTQMRRSVELDPLSPLANTNLGSIYWSSHQFDRAIEQLNRALDITPNFPDAHLYIAMVYETLQRYDQALAELEKCRTLGSTSDADPEIARIYVLQGRQTEAVRLLEKLLTRHKAHGVSAYNIAVVYAAIGDNEHAFQWLRNSYAEHGSDLLQINDDLRFDSLHPDQRFRDLLRSINYPE
jgi:Tfp pilus assembly protein PilF